MPVRLTKPYGGQAVNTLYWGSDQSSLRNVGLADDQIELASDYAPWTRIVTAAVATVSQNALKYQMNSGSAQVLNLPLTGFFPVGTVLTVEQLGTGATTVTPATGVTVSLGNGITSLITKGQNYVGQLEKVGPNSWNAFGGFSG
jgi:hypothetical protein